MTARKEALQGLLAAVEAGDADHSFDGMGFGHISRVRYAFNGSLNAAKALHEAVLSDHRWEVWRVANFGGHPEYGVNISTVDTVFGPDPARAWLCAILKALIEHEGDA